MVIKNSVGINTTTVGFIKTNAHHVATEDYDWLHEYKLNAKLVEVKGSLEEMLRALLPLARRGATKEMFIPTSSPWSLYVGNGSMDLDAMSRMRYMAKRCQCTAMRVEACEEEKDSFNPGQEGSTIWGLYNSSGKTVRDIYLGNDQGRWTFMTEGEPLPFENLEYYKAKKKRDRFNKRILEEYLRHLGIDVFNPDFYAPPGSTAYMLEEIDSKDVKFV